MGVAGLNETPSSMRVTISFFGRTNSGKSSLINAITDQNVALVSKVSGTTTDPVTKTMEIYPIGPCVLIDTAGFDDKSQLGAMRIEKTEEMLKKTDLAVLVAECGRTDFSEEKIWLESIKNKKIPVVCALNKSDTAENIKAECDRVRKELTVEIVPVSAEKKTGIDGLKKLMSESLPKDYEMPSIVGHLAGEGDTVMLVMPQDIQAPKGRLILPQVQVTRDLLDNKAIITSVTTDKMTEALSTLCCPPKLIITDSQAFRYVYDNKPKESMLTSFSTLLARYKGDIDEFIKGANAIDMLTENDRVLIAEACTHSPLDGDIGRVKIPSMLRKKFGQSMKIDVVSGNKFPVDLSAYSLVIHCGGCMFNRRYMLNRIKTANQFGVPITNYGIFIAKVNGILEYISI